MIAVHNYILSWIVIGHKLVDISIGKYPHIMEVLIK